MKIKRLLVTTISIFLIILLLPKSYAGQSNDDIINSEDVVAKVYINNKLVAKDSLVDAIFDAEPDSTISVEKDTTLDDKIVLLGDENKDKVIDLKGHTITIKKNLNITKDNMIWVQGDNIEENYSLTIKNGTIISDDDYDAIISSRKAKLILENVNIITSAQSAINATCSSVYIKNTKEDAEKNPITIKTTNSIASVIKLINGAYCDIGRNVNIEGVKGIWAQDSTLIVDGTVKTTTTKINTAGIFVDSTCKVTVNGKIESASNGLQVSGEITTNIKEYPDITIGSKAEITGNIDGIALLGYNKTTINGGEIIGTKNGINVQAGKLKINNGKVTAGKKINDSVTLTKNGNAINVSQNDQLLALETQIEDGTFEGIAAINETAGKATQETDLKKVNIKINGGSFKGKTTIENNKINFSIFGGRYNGDITIPKGENFRVEGGIFKDERIKFPKVATKDFTNLPTENKNEIEVIPDFTALEKIEDVLDGTNYDLRNLYSGKNLTDQCKEKIIKVAEIKCEKDGIIEIKNGKIKPIAPGETSMKVEVGDKISNVSIKVLEHSIKIVLNKEVDVEVEKIVKSGILGQQVEINAKEIEGFTFDKWNVPEESASKISNTNKTKTTAILGKDEMTIVEAHYTENQPEIIKDKTTSKIIKGQDTKVTVASNGVFSRFRGVKVDGKTVKEKDYTAEKGSTIITFTEKYVKTLKAGNHTIEILTGNKVASTILEVTNKSEKPNKKDTESQNNPKKDKPSNNGNGTNGNNSENKNNIENDTEDSSKIVKLNKTVADSSINEIKIEESMVKEASISDILIPNINSNYNDNSTITTVSGGPIVGYADVTKSLFKNNQKTPKNKEMEESLESNNTNTILATAITAFTVILGLAVINVTNNKKTKDAGKYIKRLFKNSNEKDFEEEIK